jgi:ATP/ADP translocase
VDASGDYVYKIFETASLVFCLGILNKMKNSLTRTSQEHFETLKWYYLAPPTFIMAILIHPGLNYYSPLDILWTFGLYLECFALLP